MKANSAILISKTDKKRGLFILTSAEGQVIYLFESNPEQGYLVLSHTAPKLVPLLSGTQLKMVTRTCLFKGDVDALEFMVDEWSEAGKIPGQILITEYLEKDLPASVYEKDGDNRGALKGYAENLRKIAGDTGVACSLGGQDIFRMKSYSIDPADKDVFIKHDNADAIIAVQTAMKKAGKSIDPNHKFEEHDAELEATIVAEEKKLAEEKIISDALIAAKKAESKDPKVELADVKL